MSIKSLILASSALFAAVALAQASLGTVGKTQGIVTFTDGATVGTVTEGSTITDGMQFVTTSDSSVTLKLNNGCTLTLQPRQVVTVDKDMTCQELVAAVRPVGGVLVGGEGGSPGQGLLALGALGVGGFIVHRSLDKNPSLSGN